MDDTNISIIGASPSCSHEIALVTMPYHDNNEISYKQAFKVHAEICRNESNDHNKNHQFHIPYIEFEELLPNFPLKIYIFKCDFITED